MHELINTNKPLISDPVNCSQFTAMTVQMSVKSNVENNRVNAEASIEGSIDGQGWFTIAELSAKGSGYATDGGSFETLWSFVRANVKHISHDSLVTVYLAKRG